MIIGIDANEANLTQNRVGINEYAYNLLWAISNLQSENKFVIYLKTKPNSSLPKERDGWKYRVIPFLSCGPRPDCLLICSFVSQDQMSF